LPLPLHLFYLPLPLHLFYLPLPLIPLLFLLLFLHLPLLGLP
jgi:hypothetical protein